MRFILAVAALLSLSAPALAQQSFPTENACPANATLQCGVDGCVCQCWDGSTFNPARQAACAAPPAASSATVTPPTANGQIQPQTGVPGATLPRIRTPQTRPSPLPQTSN
jgi:hypothetical protein